MGRRWNSLKLASDEASAAGTEVGAAAKVRETKANSVCSELHALIKTRPSMGWNAAIDYEVPASMSSARFPTPLVPKEHEIDKSTCTNHQGLERRLLGILAVDVEGYCRHVEIDEEGTYQRIQHLRRCVLKPAIAYHHGRTVNFCGDGVLVTFRSAVGAVQCAVLIQDAMKLFNMQVAANRCMQIRIGVSIDDAIVSGGSVYGHGVNVASRLESKAEPGGILISGAVFDQINGRIPVCCQALGRRRLKNFPKRVRVYSVAAPESCSASQFEGAAPTCEDIFGQVKHLGVEQEGG